MNRALLIATVVAVGWYGNYHYRHQQGDPLLDVAWSQPAESDTASFTCDGRTYCSQMTSCAEATYFISHCPGTKMDGDGDGIPCERQWCN
ncbi:MAG: excalibur calcium-binding domain-containing protein [Chromatiaceae bacterium]